ncbi:Nitrilotriacetate monooxygenase component B [hydrothermal vent metagenome]|uniref:Nitrilotriacetate monooxygenase component B n=1 Tax=hydrothermal vent metagenome TaxID=652676 RepID=A0A1W1CTZ0_9ZZZZ
MVQESDLEKMHFSSKELDKELSEAQLFSIETQSISDGYPPMIKGVPSAYFCDFNQEIDLGGGSTIPLVLNVQEIYVNDNVITDKERISINFDPVARMGKSYAFLGEEIPAPTIP